MSDVAGDSPGPAATDPVDGSWRVVEAVEGWMVEHPTKPSVGQRSTANADIYAMYVKEYDRAQVLQERIDKVRAFAEDMKTWCSPHGMALMYARRLLEVLDREPVLSTQPGSDTVRIGDHEIKLVVDPNCPPDLLLAVGSCACGHPAMGHGEDGCSTPGSATGAPCPCATPVSRLAHGVKIAPEGP